MQTHRASALLRAARRDIGVSAASLARLAGIGEGALTAYEEGAARPDPETLACVLAAAQTRPSIPLVVHADDIVAEAHRFHLANVRVFGSVVRGQDTPRSDIDLLVTLGPDASLFDLGGFAHAVEELTGFAVDVLTDDLDDEYFVHVLDEAEPL
ncbi:nucleotidyltransferase domain-containing protein [Curtobacterium sp. ISL-83]|uniref:nucleotidyltransferase domain-containing protein n=1 Tax=Curtobacterium sp. ISL-83 TaxID=2819145 RepID=UPI001BE71885|nr:XRE family transcriptional regulator [Curtobacterium sp. ISL-83]MBT2501429.1 XRE family transcriptional regulator [Curtobacterium sp. ISL-83]